jgi:hypothetical protein
MADPFSGHEALHMTSVLMLLWAKHVRSAPFVVHNPTLHKQAEKIGDAIDDFYQAVGNASFEVPAVDAKDAARLLAYMDTITAGGFSEYVDDDLQDAVDRGEPTAAAIRKLQSIAKG